MNIKNLKINKYLNKKTLTLLTIGSLSLLSGCTMEEQGELSQLFIDVLDRLNGCTHLTVFFQNETITFKECEGYSISSYFTGNNELNYSIYLNEILIIDGKTTFYNKYDVYHENIENIEDLEKEKILIK